MSNPAVVIFTDGSPNVAGWCRGAGAYKIATELRRAGYETRVLDAFAFWTDEELHALVDRYVGPDTLFVGFSTTLMGPRVTHEDEAHVPEQARARTMGLARSSIFSRSDESMRGLVARIRARNPQARIVVGGPRVEWERAHDLVDYWVVGAGDRTAVALAEHLQHGHPLIVDAGGILNQQQYPYETFSTDGILWSPEDVILPGEACRSRLPGGASSGAATAGGR